MAKGVWMSVNIHTEWGKLKEIVVGTVVNSEKYNIDLSFKLFYHSNIKDVFLKNIYHFQKKIVEQREEDLNDLETVLSKHGVKVFRPTPLERVSEFSTPLFSSFTRPCDNPRDIVLIVGNEMIETPVLNRTRYFETDQLKEIMMHYFEQGAKWSAAPRPTLDDMSFDFEYVRKNPGKYDFPIPDEIDPNRFEIMFDAAQCLKFGRDIIMNVSTENHRMGALWLQNHLGRDYKVHTVSITDHHIDGMFMPLRPGKLLINPISMKNKLHLLPKELQKWDIIEAMDIEDSVYSSQEELLLASQNISVNVLSLDEENVLVFDKEGKGHPNMLRNLEKHGFNPIPIRLRHSRLFDGGLHCATLDTVREDQLDNYLS